MKKRNKILVIIAIVLFIAIMTSLFILKNINNNFIVDEDSAPQQFLDDSYNYVTIASYDNEGEPLLDTSLIQVDNNSKASFVITLENGIDYSRDYKVLVLQNFLQTDFYVSNQKMKNQTYLFHAKSREEVSLPITVDINDDTKEISVLIIKEPKYTVTELDFQKLEYYEEVYVKRFLVDNNIDAPVVTYREQDFEYHSEVDDIPVFLSNLKNERKILPSATESSKAYLHMGNPLEDTQMNYAVIALQDWQQVCVNEDKVMYIEVPYNKTTGYDISIPPITGSNQQNLQFVAFPFPYDKWSEKYYRQVEYTFRTVITPK